MATMSENREVEVKLPFDSAEEGRKRLIAAGAVQTQSRVLEENILFDRETLPLQASGRMLRLRRRGDQVLLTYKAPIPGDHAHKVREEHESTVGDAAALTLLLNGIGFEPAWRYQKWRTDFELDGVHVCLDETPVGCFVELEGEPDAIDRVAARLGFDREHYLLDTYHDLHEKSARVRGEAAAGDMVFPEAKRPVR